MSAPHTQPSAAEKALSRTDFLLSGRSGVIQTRGQRAVLSGSVRAGVVLDASRALARQRPDSLLAGAIPFDPDAAVCLVIPESVMRTERRPPISARPEPPKTWRMTERPSRGDYQSAVREALRRIDASGGSILKVVLARTLELQADSIVDPESVLARLRADAASDTFCVRLPAGESGLPRTLIGASPELLIDKRGSQVSSLPMAGSAARGADPVADQQAASMLTASVKDGYEHRLVVEWVLDTLAPHCRTLRAEAAPILAANAAMWHLATPIEGRLKRDISSLELAAALHPTPAVCGSPSDAAQRMLRELEGFDRRFYAGTLGWCDQNGDGRWIVTIRCAEIEGRSARLFAGAGIVPGSIPESECDETAAKFRTLLRALGIDERQEAAALRGHQ